MPASDFAQTRPIHYDITHGPSAEELVTALRWRTFVPRVVSGIVQRPTTVKFTLSDGVGFGAFDFVVDGLLWEDLTTLTITVEFFGNDQPLGERWSGEYDFRTHKGAITSERGQQSLARLGWPPHIVERLLKHVTTLAELVKLDEFTVCSILLDDIYTSGGMSNSLVGEAIDSFDQVRHRLDRMGLRLKGNRHDLNELNMMF